MSDDKKIDDLFKEGKPNVMIMMSFNQLHMMMWRARVGSFLLGMVVGLAIALAKQMGAL